ncbi:hypothetical protein LOK49_LG01G02817 [Camellia lanceoleosa]|uniref:Uncharacterized protein n=1 Tax=Camellia lanceoleosa TaxID=1840588 RepID=A0ACC0IT88_9ERIC|nr:hypothetical protein LOK49_LG01G02817 [Camellia lanceoleosa]
MYSDRTMLRKFYVPSRLRFVICFVYSQTLDIGSFCASRSFEAEIDHERSFGFPRRTVRPAVSANFS